MNLVKLDYDVFFRRRDVGKLAFDKIVTPPKKGERRWLRYGGGKVQVKRVMSGDERGGG